MEVYYGIGAVPPLQHPVVTVGSFDGVHPGHRELLRRTVDRAAAAAGTSVVVTFDPHPRQVLDPEGVGLLSTTPEKIDLLRAAGVDVVVVLPFTLEFSRMPPEQFMREYIVDGLGARTLVVGYNHHFGRDKQGSGTTLRQITMDAGLVVEIVERQSVAGSRVSSTVIRDLLADGKVCEASGLLGYDYFITAVVKNGEIQVASNKLMPADGRYRVAVIAGKLKPFAGDRAQCSDKVVGSSGLQNKGADAEVRIVDGKISFILADPITDGPVRIVFC